MRVQRSKTEFCINARDEDGTVKPQGADVAKVDELLHLGSTVLSSGDCGGLVKE